jgi:hypothetical protein
MSLTLHSNRKNWGLPAAALRAARTPTASPLTSIFSFVRKVAVKSAELIVIASETSAEARMHKAMIEVELYRNRYRHASKSDDDLPIIGLPIAGSAPAEQVTPSVFPRVALMRAAGAAVALAKRVYPAILVLSLLATVLAVTMAIRLALWLPLYMSH